MKKRLIKAGGIALLALCSLLPLTSTALADGGSCAWLTSNYSGCVYSPVPYAQTSGSFTYIQVIIQSGFPSNISKDILAAMDNWNNSGSHVRLYTSPSSQGNTMTIYPSSTAPHGGTWNNDCTNSAWGQSWAGGSGDPLYHKVALNSNLFPTANCGTADLEWDGVIVHEMGHAMGLFHNNVTYVSGSKTVNARMAFNAVHLPGCTIGCNSSSCDPANGYGLRSNGTCYEPRPQVTDYWLLNQLYPNYSTQCASWQNNDNCNGMDPVEQNCGGSPLYTNDFAATANGVTYGYFNIYYSSTCKTNWTKARATLSGWSIYRILLTRDGGAHGSNLDGPQETTEDLPASHNSSGGTIWYTTWYTNMIFSPNNKALACVSFISGSTITNFFCTPWT